jgi:hypothetical protein
MTDYALTAGQQQLIVDFIHAGKGVYIEGTDFGSFHLSDPVFKLFGIIFMGSGSSWYNVQTMKGQSGTLLDGMNMNYPYGDSYPDQNVDYFYPESDKTKILGKCHSGYRRISAYTGEDETYRAIHSSIWFGAMIEDSGTHTKAEIMAAYMRFLSGHSLVTGLNDEVSCNSGGKVNLFLENTSVQAHRQFAVLGSMTGTTPGFPAGSVWVPLNFDIFTKVVILHWNTPTFLNFLGNLDETGRGHALLNVFNMDPGAAGVTMNFAYILANPIDFASNPAAVNIVP